MQTADGGDDSPCIIGYDRLFKAALDGNAHEEYAAKGHCGICPLPFCREEWECAHHL